MQNDQITNDFEMTSTVQYHKEKPQFLFQLRMNFISKMYKIVENIK
jgi:hypothetical protein